MSIGSGGLAARVKRLAVEVGFDLAGVARAEAPRELAFFAEWISRGYAGEMAYLTSQLERRSDLRSAFPWARSVISVGLQYDTAQPYSTEAPADHGWISRYAWGDDYHHVMKTLLDVLAERLREDAGPFRTRSYVDTGPIVERAYAAAAGLGAWGKNTCLLNPEHGSWFFLGELVTDLELEPDAPRPDLCGSCTACLDACPTAALRAPYVLDATRCISYLTIEVKGSIPEDRRPGIGRHVFGCDICQDVCPWNRSRQRRAASAREPLAQPTAGRGPQVQPTAGHGPQARTEFEPREGAVAPDLLALAGLDEEGWRARFRRSPIKRAKRRGLLRNVAVALGNSGDRSRRPVLERLACDYDPLVREHALWALRKIDAS